MKSTRRKKLLITCGVVLIVLVGTAGVTKAWKFPGMNGGREMEEAVTGTVMDETNIGVVTSDDPWQEMEKLVGVYYGGDQQIFYSGKMRLMDDNEEQQKLLEEHAFDYSICRGEYYYKLGSMECVSKRNFILVVNHGDQTMYVSKILPAHSKEDNLLDMRRFKQMMSASKAEAKVMQSGSSKIISVNNLEDPVVQGYQVFYDPATYRISKIIIGMIRFSPLDEDQIYGNAGTGNKIDKKVDEEETANNSVVDGYSYMLEIIYEKTEIIPTSEKEYNPENRFITPQGNGFQLAEAFKKYQLSY